MSYFTEQLTEKLTLPSDANYWVEVIKDFRYGQVKEFATTENDTVDFTTQADKFLHLAIKSWNLDDELGQILPITPENIDLLKQDDVLAIINTSNASVATDESKKN